MPELPTLRPLDGHNRTLVENVHPGDWVNPEPSGRYNVVVVGAGSAGLITAAVAAGLGARVALVERHYLGGDCLNVGCVPSKGIIRAARMVSEAQRAERELGLRLADGAEPDFGRAMERMRGIRARISHEDSALRYRDELGVEVYLGEARFSGRDTLEVAGRTLEFSRAVIASGARPFLPAIEGLAEAEPLTNETVFNLTERPRRLAVIGAGPIGCELAQAFQRLGSAVSVMHADAHLLPREDPEAAGIVLQRFREEGVEVIDRCRIEKVEKRAGEKVVRLRDADDTVREIAADEILVAVGRVPNVDDMGLEAAGVKFDARRGVAVDDYLRTSNASIFAAGDVCMDWKFTHAADAAAKIVVQNALFLPSKKLSALVMPWCTYTDPEVAHVGLYERDAKAAGQEVDCFRVSLADVNRAVADGEDEGFVKILVKRGTDKILGATIVSAHAGETISEVTLAMVGGLGLSKILDVIHPYPTQAEGIKRAAGLHARGRVTPFVKRALERWMALRR